MHSLSDSQSILLLADVDGPEPLLTALFANAFDIFSESTSGGDVEISKSVEFHLKNLLSLVVDEVDVPQEVTDIIISQFMRVGTQKQREQSTKGRKSDAHDTTQGTLLLKDYPVAYNIAKAICTTCEEKMTAQVTQYFNTVIVDAGTLTADDDRIKYKKGHGDDEEDDESLSDLRKAHRLLRELWRACPDVIANVIPQVEAELQADSVALRRLATETLGDITAGIGIAGFVPLASIDPAAYPLPSIDRPEPMQTHPNPLLMPAAPKPFIAVHRTPYQNFFGRRNDRSSIVREAWVESAARILSTRAGGIGLSDDEQLQLLKGYAQSLRDGDERVRLAAIRTLSQFDYHGIVTILAADGGLAQSTSVFSALAERFSDRKLPVREEAIAFAARVWGTASLDIQQGNEMVQNAIGDLASRLFNTYYLNDTHVHSVLDRALFEALLPLGFPHGKTTQTGKRKSRSDESASQETSTQSPDTIRAQRMLTLVRSLDDKARRVLLGMQGRQTQISKGVSLFLQACEEYNGGVVEEKDEEAKLKTRLNSYIDVISKTFHDSAKMADDLKKFAKQHDRRNYQLIRFAIGAEYDYKTMNKAAKELFKRIREGPSSTQNIVESMQLLIYRSAIIMYNRSHVPTIMDLARADEYGLASAAHEVLREISSKTPEVLRSHIKALCVELEQTAPSATRAEDPSAADALKTCAQYARKYPEEVSKDRKFLTALTNFALYSNSPRAAKHAVSTILLVADRKEMYAKEIMTKALKDCRVRSSNCLARLAAIGQICRYAPDTAADDSDAISTLVLEDILHQNLSPSAVWEPSEWDAKPDEETQAKELCLKVLANQCRAEDAEHDEDFGQLTETVYNILLKIVKKEGEITPTFDTPSGQRNRLRLAAARLILKLCVHKHKRFERLTPAENFHAMAWIVIHPPNELRNGFVKQIKKYHGQGRLNHRWLTILFLLAFEPDDELRISTINFLKSRTQFLERQQQASKPGDKHYNVNTMEVLFARLLSLLAYHPDYPPEGNDFDRELIEYSKYMVLYLVAVANEDNISLIFHVAQRVKQLSDGVGGDEDQSNRLYVLSDLAQTVIRHFADTMPHAKGANVLQTWPGKVDMPKSLFRLVTSHSEAQKIAEKNYLPEDTALGLEKFVKDSMKQLKGYKSTKKSSHAGNDKKRKSDSAEPDELDEKPKKKKKSSLPIRKASKAKAKTAQAASSPEAHEPSRKSTRVSNAISYAEESSDDDEDAEDKMEDVATSSSPTTRKVQQPLSSPGQVIHVQRRSRKAEEEDTEMVDANGDVEIHEDDDADEEADDADDAEDDERDVTPSPSPLKERENTPGPPSPDKPTKSKKGKVNGKVKGKEAAASAKSTPASTRRKASASTPAVSVTTSAKKKSRTSAVSESAADVENTRATRASRRSRG